MQVAPCASDARVQTSWAVTCSDPSAKDKVESSDGFRATKNQNTLKISKGVFTSDVNCTFTVTASMKYDPSVKTSISQDIKALPSPLEAAILGGKNNFVICTKCEEEHELVLYRWVLMEDLIAVSEETIL